MPPRRTKHDYSIPRKGPFVACIFFGVLHYLAVLGTGVAVYLFLHTRDVAFAWWLAGLFVAFGVTWLLNYLARRSTRCPLCKGTPLLDTPATKHQKAVRLKPLNYGTTALLRLILTRRFRCMDCGTPFDLARKPSRDRR